MYPTQRGEEAAVYDSGAWLGLDFDILINGGNASPGKRA